MKDEGREMKGWGRDSFLKYLPEFPGLRIREEARKESRPFTPARRLEPNTLKYPVQEVGGFEPCAGESERSLIAAVRSGMGLRSQRPGPAHPRRQLEQFRRQWQLARLRPQQRRVDERHTQQQCGVPPRQDSLADDGRGMRNENLR